MCSPPTDEQVKKQQTIQDAIAPHTKTFVTKRQSELRAGWGYPIPDPTFRITYPEYYPDEKWGGDEKEIGNLRKWKWIIHRDLDRTISYLKNYSSEELRFEAAEWMASGIKALDAAKIKLVADLIKDDKLCDKFTANLIKDMGSIHAIDKLITDHQNRKQ